MYSRNVRHRPPLIAAIVTAIVAVLLSGCTPPGPTPGTPHSPTPTASGTAVDFTSPGAGLKVVRQLIDAARNSKLIMVQVSRTEATINVVTGTQVQAWGYRDGEIKQVSTDTQYVDQAIFDVNDFNLTDIGALFRAAASVSGSESDQRLQIVDYSAGAVWMAVSTNPESRTVFFRPDGSILATIDFATKSGIEEGLTDTMGTLHQTLAVGIDSQTGAYVDFVGPNNTTMRRLRTSRFPPSTSARSEAPNRPEFDPHIVDPSKIWDVLQRLRADGEFSGSTQWKVDVSADESLDGRVVMHFDVGGKRFTTDISGERL